MNCHFSNNNMAREKKGNKVGDYFGRCWGSKRIIFNGGSVNKTRILKFEFPILLL